MSGIFLSAIVGGQMAYYNLFLYADVFYNEEEKDEDEKEGGGGG